MKKFEFSQRWAWFCAISLSSLLFYTLVAVVPKMLPSKKQRLAQLSEQPRPDEHSGPGEQDAQEHLNHALPEQNTENLQQQEHQEHQEHEKDREQESHKQHSAHPDPEEDLHQGQNKNPGDLPASKEDADIQWSYSGQSGPEAWGRISKDFYKCEHGSEQSPVNIEWPQKKHSLSDLQVQYKPSKVKLKSDDQSIDLQFLTNNEIVYGKNKYKLANMHFHTPSEHRVEGVPFSAEIHFVHLGANDQSLVLAVFLEQTQKNAVADQLFTKIEHISPGQQINYHFNPKDLLPKNLSYYTYKGSLTTPPCTEDVTWIIMKENILLSSMHLEMLKSKLHHNTRPLQMLGKRIVYVQSGASSH